MDKGKELRQKERGLPVEGPPDDLYDGLLRDVVSREVARREGREEGQTVTVEPIPGGESIVVGRRDALDRFHELLQQERASYREVEVERFPTEPDKVEKVRRMVLPRLSYARERLGLPKLSVLSELTEGLLEAGEDVGAKAGLPLEPGTNGGEATLEQIDDATKGFNPRFDIKKEGYDG